MRVAEVGLRALANDRRVSFQKNGPLELRTWEEVIRGLEDAETAIHKLPKTEAREAQFEFYHGAMQEFRAFKNLWRNRIMHSREEYDRDQAASAMVHVRGFMQGLARKISETKKVPLVWLKP